MRPRYPTTLESYELLKMCLNYHDNSSDYYQPVFPIFLKKIRVMKKEEVAYIDLKSCVQKYITFEHMVIMHVLKTSNHYFFATKGIVSRVCNDWYRYLKESSTAFKLESNILNYTDQLARDIRQMFCIYRSDCYMLLKDNFLRSMPYSKYDLHKLWEKIEYKKAKKPY